MTAHEFVLQATCTVCDGDALFDQVVYELRGTVPQADVWPLEMTIRHLPDGSHEPHIHWSRVSREATAKLGRAIG